MPDGCEDIDECSNNRWNDCHKYAQDSFQKNKNRPEWPDFENLNSALIELAPMNVNVYQNISVMGLTAKILTNAKQKLTFVEVVEYVPILMVITDATAKMVSKNWLTIRMMVPPIDMVLVSTSMNALKIQMAFI